MDERLNHNNILCEGYSRRLQSWGWEAFQKIKTKNPKANKKRERQTDYKKKFKLLYGKGSYKQKQTGKITFATDYKALLSQY